MIEMVEHKVNPEGFGYRVAGVLLNNGKVLLSTDDQVDFWVLPGGGVKPFESSEEAHCFGHPQGHRYLDAVLAVYTGKKS